MSAVEIDIGDVPNLRVDALLTTESTLALITTMQHASPSGAGSMCRASNDPGL